MGRLFSRPKATGVWMGLRQCGCPVAVVTDYTGTSIAKETRADTTRCKREFMRDGLSVVYATWEQWTTIYGPKLASTCEHERAKAVPQASADEDAALVPKGAT